MYFPFTFVISFNCINCKYNCVTQCAAKCGWLKLNWEDRGCSYLNKNLHILTKIFRNCFHFQRAWYGTVHAVFRQTHGRKPLIGNQVRRQQRAEADLFFYQTLGHKFHASHMWFIYCQFSTGRIEFCFVCFVFFCQAHLCLVWIQ